MALWSNGSWASVWDMRKNDNRMNIHISNSSKAQDGTYINDFNKWVSVAGEAKKKLDNINFVKPKRGERPMQIRVDSFNLKCVWDKEKQIENDYVTITQITLPEEENESQDVASSSEDDSSLPF